MGSLDGGGLEGGDYLEAQLLTDPVAQSEDEDGGDSGRILYRASFEELEHAHVNYDTVQWMLIALLLVLVYGVGLLLLLYVPIRRYIVRQDIRNRELYVTTQAVVYKVRRPIFLPCCGVSVREKHVLLNLVTDMIIEEGCLQSCFGISTIRVENARLGWPAPGLELRMQGVANPRLFKRMVLIAAANIRQRQMDNGDEGSRASLTENGLIEEFQTPPQVAGAQLPPPWSWQQGVTPWQMTYPSTLQRDTLPPATGEAMMRKLEGLEASVKRIELLIEGRHEASSSK